MDTVITWVALSLPCFLILFFRIKYLTQLNVVMAFKQYGLLCIGISMACATILYSIDIVILTNSLAGLPEWLRDFLKYFWCEKWQ